ncbi:MerR family transcriptional regulator [Sinorhizobium sp. A49]|uniref:MerR family transcriptional regulator n=1 Tax=Sinorhizobium sp. A49 TaxID=1945861 RepID=UPI000985EF6F|nr:MerR family transcriptional regulator [Sinorhizobium sp. A49]OOG67428.1 MerR family transcriptional regulator [Sinorhizobium sp. A49]
MSDSTCFLTATEAARRLGVSVKALRLYEQHGLITPVRTSAGWRTYGPVQMRRAGEIAALRSLGLALAQIRRVLDGGVRELGPTLALQQGLLEARARDLQSTVAKVQRLRRDLANGADNAPGLQQLVQGQPSSDNPEVAFDLPWPWGGEAFKLHTIHPLTYIIGPLGSGKTRLAKAIATALPGAVFVGIDRLEEEASMAARRRLEMEPQLKSRIDTILVRLVDDGAVASPPLTALLVALEADAKAFVVDMVEQDLDAASQTALLKYLRHRRTDRRPIFMLTRSNAVLDLAALGPGEAIILCPANHSPPTEVAPYPGAPGYETVANCLASPEVRARTQGVIAWRPEVA